MVYLRRLYDRLHITLGDADMAPESFYNPMLADVCAELEEAVQFALASPFPSPEEATRYVYA